MPRLRSSPLTEELRPIRFCRDPPELESSRFLVVPQCVKPRNSNVSGLPRHAAVDLWAANRPNSISRVFSGCSSRPNFASRSRSSPGTARPPPDAGTPPRNHRHNGRRSRRRARSAAATGAPTGRRRSAGTRSRAAAKPPPLAVSLPSSPTIAVLDTPAFSHFWIRRRTLRSAIRCSTNFTSHSWSMVSKKPRMSASSTQFTFFPRSPPPARPAPDAGCAPAETRTRSPESPPRRSR